MSTFITRMDGAWPALRLAIKDLIDIAGVPTTAGSQALARLAAPAAADAQCLWHIRELADRGQLRVVGKTNLHELAYGISGINHWFGTPVNPVDPLLIPGGSSSGSAVAVATGEADVALGTDTGGSVRIPAACCGVAGLKTTWGRISTAGVWPLAPSLDTIGPLARDVAGLVLGMSLLEPAFEIAPEAAVTVGRLRLNTESELDAGVDGALLKAEFHVADVRVEGWDDAWHWADQLLSAEAWHSDRGLVEGSPELVGNGVRIRIEAGAHINDAQIERAHRAQKRWRTHLIMMLEGKDALVLPTLPTHVPTLAAPVFAGSRHTLPVNFAGLPALALPLPGAKPTSIQLIGAPHTEEKLLAIGKQIEAASRAG